MYQLIIADDEKIIRESLARFINWTELGFELVLLAEDGEPVLDYLKQKHADVVFCDIMMHEKSGLDVAEYIYKNKIACEVVLLSGYHDFEYARKAIQYNVQEYLLKPINLSKIKECFEQVRIRLDEKEAARKEKEQIEKQIRQYRHGILEKMLEMSRAGLMGGKEVCGKYIEGFNIDQAILEISCFVLHIKTPPFAEYDTMARDIISNIFMLLSNQFPYEDLFIQYTEKEDELDIIMLRPEPFEPSEREMLITSLQSAIRDICGVQASVAVGFENGRFWEYLVSSNHEMAIRYASEQEFEFYTEAMARQYLLTLNLTQDGEKIRGEISKVYMEAVLNHRRSLQINYMREIFKKMIDLIRQQYPERSDISLKEYQTDQPLKDYFDDVMEYFFQLLHQETEENQTMVERIRALILSRISENVSLKEAADSVFLSPNYFCKLFKEQAGEHYSEYCIRVKMEQAAKMLEDPYKKIYEISDGLGYKNVKYFYKLFKRVFNCTPSEYREQKGKR